MAKSKIRCQHKNAEPGDLAKLIATYHCPDCGQDLLCKCDAEYLSRNDKTKYKKMKSEYKVASKICVVCQNKSDLVKAYGRSLFARIKWREVSKEFFDLLNYKYKARRDIVKEYEKIRLRKLNKMLEPYIVNDAYTTLLENFEPYSSKYADLETEAIKKWQFDIRQQDLRKALFRMYRIKRDKKSVSTILKLKDTLPEGMEETLEEIERSEDVLHKIQALAEREAENTIRKKYEVPLIGEGWVSETYLYNLVKVLFSPEKVIAHARLPWLSQQHLDIFVPSKNLAFEYMGEQHYKPVERFGGKEALRNTKRLDQKKKKLCKENNVTLIYFRYNEDLSIESIEKKLSKHFK